jgi:hypothetical protein
LTTLTRETGGTLLLPASTKDLEGVYGDIAAELRTQYSLGYTSSNGVRDGQWRRISIRVPARKGLEVRHRMGYYAASRSRAARGPLELPGARQTRPRAESAAGRPVVPRSQGSAAAGEGPTPAGLEDPVAEEPSPWMDIRDGVLEMELAHEEADGADYGSLRVEPLSRRFTWSAGPGPGACARPVDRSFDDILSVSASKHAGFLVEFRPGAGETMHLIPAPYAMWLEDRGLRRSDLPKELLVETRTAVASLLEVLGRAPSAGQTALYAFYGTPVAVALEDLFESPADYEGRAVRVRGNFEIVSRDLNRYGLYSSSQTIEASEDLEYTLSLDPTDDFALELSPVHELAAFVSSHAPRWEDEGVEVAGVFRRLSALSGRPGRQPPFRVRFWDVTTSEPAAPVASVIGRPTTLADLVAAEGKLDGRLVRVIGRFRGQNLYGDLPNASRRKSEDWVIKDGPSAAWVTGKPPAGSGWRLDPTSAKDSINWLQVVGRPKTRRGFVHLHALEVIPSIAPSPDAMADPTRVQVRTYGSPVVTFALPETGERISPDAQFVIQFSNPMDPASLQGRVRLDYASPRAGDREFEWLRVTYSDHTRHIVVDPGRPLLPGRTLNCQLLPGIVDAEGQPLGPRPGSEGDHAVEVLQFQVSP